VKCKLSWNLENDPWLGALHQFPTVLNARASFLYDINLDSLQKAIMSALGSLQRTPKTSEITIADLAGYSEGQVVFKLGIGNGDGFDSLDLKEEERVLQRLENHGPFATLDLAFHLHYMIDDGRRHRVHEDHYIVRLAFQPGRVEVLVHHLKGVKRIQPDELVHLVLRELNVELGKNRYPLLELESLNST